MTPDAAVAQIARQQHGALARQQAIAAGLGEDAVDLRVRQGRWERSRRGVYVIAGAPPTERQAVMVVTLATGAPASHLTAARLWGFDLPAPSSIEVVGRPSRLEGVVGHRSETLATHDVVHIGAIPLTSPARTLVDCSGRVPPERLGPIVDDGLRRGLVRLDALRECHERVATGPGRRHTIAMRHVLEERAPGHRSGDSQREADLLRLLTRSGLPAPVLGHRVRIGRRTYKLDVAWPEVLAALEFDGWDTHHTFTAFHGDRQRLRRLVAAGWRIIPITSKTNLDELLGDVVRLVTGAKPAA